MTGEQSTTTIVTGEQGTTTIATGEQGALLVGSVTIRYEQPPNILNNSYLTSQHVH